MYNLEKIYSIKTLVVVLILSIKTLVVVLILRISTTNVFYAVYCVRWRTAAETCRHPNK